MSGQAWRSRRRPRRRLAPGVWLVVALVAAGSIALLLVGWVARVRLELVGDRFVLGQWQPLDVRGWTEATAGFRAPGQSDLPLVNGDPAGAPLRVDGRAFDTTLGLYPYAEAVYALGGAYEQLRATVVVEPRPWQPAGSAQLLVYGDGALLYDSSALASRGPPLDLRVAIEGVRELRLVAVAGDDAEPAVLYLAEPALQRLLLGTPPTDPAGLRARLLATRQQHQRQRLEAALRREGADRARAVRRWRASRGPADAVLGGRLPSGSLVLSNTHVAVLVETAGEASGTFGVVDLGHGRVVASGLRPAVVLADGSERALADMLPGEPLQLPAEAATLGAGRTLRVPFRDPDADLAVALEVSVFGSARAALLQLHADQPVERFHLLDGASGGVLVGEAPRYLTDFSRPREALVRDDGLVRGELVGLGAPVFLWSVEDDNAVVLAALDETAAPPRFEASRAPGDLRLQLRLTTPPLRTDASRSPRLYFEATDTADPRTALEAFRALSLALHPPPPVPDWVRHQWGSWYVYGTHVDESHISEFIDYIASYLGDVGPWHILLDAGWFVAEGRPGGELGRVDPGKFPSGIRALVDHAHARGIRVILYYSAPYVDTRAVVSEWLALPGFIEQYRDWLIPLGAVDGQESFAYDFSHPGLQGYMRELLRRYYVEWNADGILVDMLGHTEGAALNLRPPDRFGVVGPALGQSLDIYHFLWRETQRLRPDAFVEGAWDTPLLARSYAHTWRYADDAPQFRGPYPFGGLVEHIDYAILQHLLLAQRPHMGALTGQPDARLHYWWLGAGLALGGQVVLSLPFTIVDPADLNTYRAYLTQMRPFAGTTRLGEGLRPETFATSVDGTSFVGVLNRTPGEREIPVDLEELGLSEDAVYLVYDVEQERPFAARGGFVARLAGESFRLFVARGEAGVLWTTSSYAPRAGEGCLSLGIGGPAAVPGALQALTAQPSAVYLDGRALPEMPGGAEGWQYDASLGLLSLHYLHRGASALDVVC